MPAFPDRKPTSGSAGPSPNGGFGCSSSSDEDRWEPVSDGSQSCVCCELEEGLPVIRQHVPSYYTSRPGRGLMLILERKQGERLRISDAVEVVVLGINDGEVELGLSYPPEVIDGRGRPDE